MRGFTDRIFVRFVLRGQEGQGLVEYGLVLVFVSLVVIAALTIFGVKVGNIFNYAGNSLNL